MGSILLTREQFRDAVFGRDKFKCVVCGGPGIDAHHILDRKLFPDGGYYLDNGVTLCGKCHLLAETSDNHNYSPQTLRAVTAILVPVLPPGFDPALQYDKWGTPYSQDPTKYPHTPHLPWSPGFDAEEDMVLESTDQWTGTEVVITEKMDGEGTSMYRDNYHARSTSYAPHPSRSRARAIWGTVRYDIPVGWKLCGENVSAVHSIKYTELPAYFLVFSIWDETMLALDWDSTEEWCGMLDLFTVPVLWRGMWNEGKCREIIDGLDLTRQEGVVIRPAGRYDWDHIADKQGVMGKWVRRGHVTTDEHWMKKPVEWNILKGAS
jgi:hypothetical protein